jgi:hypothetical protein
MNYATMIEQEYSMAMAQPSDINEHIQMLYGLGKHCKHVTEMGVRDGKSSRAFLKAGVTLRSYDIEKNANVEFLFECAKKAGQDVEYIIDDVLKVKIEPTDLLFIDTWHSNPQLRQELELHGNLAQKFLVFHDTWTYGLQDESWDKIKPNYPGAGLLPAIIDFVIENPHWQFQTFRTNNNGLTVLKRK